MSTRMLAPLLVLVLLSACTSTAFQPSASPSSSRPTAAATVSAPMPSATAGVPVSTQASSLAPPADVTPTDAPLQPASNGLSLPPGFRVEVYASGLRDPTALAWGSDHRLYITQLNGGENDQRGQVVVVDRVGAAPTVMLDGLLKPTGLVWRENDLFVIAGRDVLQTGDDGTGRLRQPTPLVRDLPFNTRSEGQIDVLPDGQLVFEASGLVQDAQSGRLFTLAPGGEPHVLATGLKNAYGHAVDPSSGQIYTTDVGDDPVDGQAPPEEINAVVTGGDYGWPRCYAERIPAADRGATTESCAATQPSLVTFPPHTTPTGLTFYAGSDFPAAYRNVLYVALWNGNPPHVFRVTLNGTGAHATGTATPFIDGLKNPIDLLPDPDGGLLVLDFTADVVYRIQAEGEIRHAKR